MCIRDSPGSHSGFHDQQPHPGKRGREMKVTLDIPDGIVCGFFNGVEITSEGMSLVSYQLGSDDLTDGKTTKLPREKEK